jgi:hypothetical protein
MITYKHTIALQGKSDLTRVFLGNRLAGVIAQTRDGKFQYRPKGSKVYGDKFDTLAECKKSLEGK